MTSSPQQELLAAAREMASAPLPEPAAETFLRAWPLPRVFEALSSAPASASDHAAAGPSQTREVAAALSRALKTPAGARALPEAEPYARAALRDAPSPALRRLGAEQLGRLLALRRGGSTGGDGGDGSGGWVGAGTGGTSDAHEAEDAVAAELAAALSDPDSGVAAEAEAALRAHAASSPRAFGSLVDPSTAAGAALRALADGRDAVPRMRALSLLAGAAAAASAGCQGSSGGGAPAGGGGGGAQGGGGGLTAALEESGLVRALMRELDDPARDPLSALSALAVAQQMLDDVTGGAGAGGGASSAAAAAARARGEGASSAVRALAAALLPRLSEVLFAPSNRRCDPTVLSGALPIAARLASAALQEEADERAAAVAAGHSNGCGPAAAAAAAASSSPAAELARPLLRALPALLDDDDRDFAHAALDAVGQLCETAAAADFVAREAAAEAEGSAAFGGGGANASRQPPTALAAVCELALSRAGAGGAPHARVAALHALASLAGGERAGERRERAAALLGPAAEGALRRAAYAASAPRSPSDAVAALTRQPFAEVSAAAYRLAAALLLRGWFAGDAAAAAALAAAAAAANGGGGDEQPAPQQPSEEQPTSLLDLLLPPLAPDAPPQPAPRTAAEAQWRRACANALSATLEAAAAEGAAAGGGGGGGGGTGGGTGAEEHPDSDASDLRHSRAALLGGGLAERAARAAGGGAAAGGARPPPGARDYQIATMNV